jgi:hypothetical protein
LRQSNRWANLARVCSCRTVAALVALGLVACLPEFNPELGDDATTATSEFASCGAQGTPCCAPPAEACLGDSTCAADSQLCTRRPVLLCAEDAECRPGEVCCTAGLIGTCESVAKQDCPALDLVVATPALDVDAIESRFFDPQVESDRCLIERGCVGGPGLRRLLRLSTTVDNVGEADLLLGSPEDTTSPTTTTCNGEPRFADFLRYELVDASGTKTRQDVPANCSAPTSSGFIAPFDCDFQGLWSGFSQSYEPVPIADGPSDSCRWLDVTDVLPGEYTVRVTVNPDGLLPEQNLGNNTPAELPLVIPVFGDPSRPCADPPNPLLGSSVKRECGWVRAEFQSDGQATPCDIEDSVWLTCTSQTTGPLCGDYRLCDGPELCEYRDAVPINGVSCYAPGESNASISCPPTGEYSLWFEGDNPDGFSCEPYVYEFFDPTSVAASDAGVPAEP